MNTLPAQNFLRNGNGFSSTVAALTAAVTEVAKPVAGALMKGGADFLEYAKAHGTPLLHETMQNVKTNTGKLAEEAKERLHKVAEEANQNLQKNFKAVLEVPPKPAKNASNSENPRKRKDDGSHEKTEKPAKALKSSKARETSDVSPKARSPRQVVRVNSKVAGKIDGKITKAATDKYREQFKNQKPALGARQISDVDAKRMAEQLQAIIDDSTAVESSPLQAQRSDEKDGETLHT